MKNKNEKRELTAEETELVTGGALTASGGKMHVQIRSLEQENYNPKNGNAMMKVAEGAVSSTVEILRTLKEKTINAANDTNTDVDRASIQKPIDESIA